MAARLAAREAEIEEARRQAEIDAERVRLQREEEEARAAKGSSRHKC